MTQKLLKTRFVKPAGMLLIIMMVVIAITLLIRNQFLFREAVTQSVRDNLQSLADSEAKALQARLESILQDMELIASNPYIWNLNLEGVSQSQDQQTQPYNPGEKVYTIYKNFISGISRVSADGIIMGRVPFNEASIGIDISREKGIIISKETHRSSIAKVIDERGKSAYAIYTPVLSVQGDSRNFLGTIRTTISIETIDDYLDRFQLKDPGHSWLEDSDKEIVAHPGHVFHGKLHDQAHQEYSRLIVHAPISILDQKLYLGLSVPVIPITSPVDRHLKNTLLLVFILLLLILAFGYYRNRKSKKISLLEIEYKYMQQVKEALEEKEKLARKIITKKAQFEELADMLPECVFESDVSMKLTYLNKKAFDLFGYHQQDFERGLSGVDMIAPDYRALAAENASKRVKGEIVGGNEYEGIRKDGSTFPILMHVNTIEQDGKFTGFRGVIVDITDRKEAEKQIEASLREKETLLHEIHHRVKNNMQIIASLLDMQLNRNDQQSVDTIVKESKGRVYAMAAIHECLYESETLSEIDLNAYTRQLSNLLSQTYLANLESVHFDFDIPEVKLAIDKANPLGLVMNELISNSLKYAFPEDKKGRIRIESTTQGDIIELIISDNGVGIPNEIDWKKTKTLGLRLVQDLIERQLNGSIEFKNQNGARFTIKFNLKST